MYSFIIYKQERSSYRNEQPGISINEPGGAERRTLLGIIGRLKKPWHHTISLDLRLWSQREWAVRQLVGSGSWALSQRSSSHAICIYSFPIYHLAICIDMYTFIQTLDERVKQRRLCVPAPPSPCVLLLPHSLLNSSYIYIYIYICIYVYIYIYIYTHCHGNIYIERDIYIVMPVLAPTATGVAGDH